MDGVVVGRRWTVCVGIECQQSIRRLEEEEEEEEKGGRKEICFPSVSHFRPSSITLLNQSYY